MKAAQLGPKLRKEPILEDSVHLVAQTSPLAGLAEMLSFSQLEGELSKLFKGKLTLVLRLFKKSFALFTEGNCQKFSIMLY